MSRDEALKSAEHLARWIARTFVLIFFALLFPLILFMITSEYLFAMGTGVLMALLLWATAKEEQIAQVLREQRED